MEKKFYYDGMYIINEGDSAEINVTNFVGLTRIEGRQNDVDEMAYFMKDAHGDVIKVLDSEDFRADYEYDIWGNHTQDTTNTFDNPFRYCSEYMGEESGLIYLRARYYDPDTGRFTQEDPARDGLNWYIYAGNNPIMFDDPTGKIKKPGFNKQGYWSEDPDADAYGKDSLVYQALVVLGENWKIANGEQQGIIQNLARIVRGVGDDIRTGLRETVYKGQSESSGTNVVEQVLCIANPLGAVTVNDNMKIAWKETISRYGADNPPGSLDNTNANAFLHAYWVALNSKDIGTGWA